MRDAGSEPVVVVSNDTHIGPRLIEDLRPYCPSKHLDDFDRFAAAAVTEKDVAPRSLTAGITGLPEPGSRLRGVPSNAYYTDAPFEWLEG